MLCVRAAGGGAGRAGGVGEGPAREVVGWGAHLRRDRVAERGAWPCGALIGTEGLGNVFDGVVLRPLMIMIWGLGLMNLRSLVDLLSRAVTRMDAYYSE